MHVRGSKSTRQVHVLLHMVCAGPWVPQPCLSLTCQRLLQVAAAEALELLLQGCQVLLQGCGVCRAGCSCHALGGSRHRVAASRGKCVLRNRSAYAGWSDTACSTSHLSVLPPVLLMMMPSRL